MEFILYFVLGFIVSIINWLFIVSKDTTDRVNVCLGLMLGMFLWPAVFVGWIYRLYNHINKSYVTIKK